MDLLLEAYKLILEYEGDHHRTGTWQWNVDIGRVEEFTAEGYRVLRVTAAHLRQPRVLINRIPAALVIGGYAGRRLCSPRSGQGSSSEVCGDAGRPVSERCVRAQTQRIGQPPKSPVAVRVTP